MKTHHVFCSLIFILIVTLTSLAQNVTCPKPSEPVGGRCVLLADADLRQTLVLRSNTTLDCQGRRLRPSTIAPRPQVAIFLNAVRNVLIKRCVIEDFDFGVFAINSKQSRLPFQSFVMFENTITARYTGITLMAVDNAEIIDNVVTYKQRAGKALYIGRDSDMNGASKNTFISNVATTDTDAFAAPGSESASNPRITERKAVVVIAHLEGTDPSLQRIVVNGELFQVVNPYIWDDDPTNSLFSEANRIEGNIIRFLGTPTDGIALAIAHSTHVISNTIEAGADRAIRLGAQIDEPRTFPGVCRRAPSTVVKEPPASIAIGVLVSAGRSCLDDSDCAGMSADPTGPFLCEGVSRQTVSWKTNRSLIQDNVLRGPFGSGIVSSGWETSIIGNSIVGPLTNPSGKGAGISLYGKLALESGVVRGNSVSNVAVALELAKTLCTPTSNFNDCDPEPMFFGAQISLNDFIGDDIAVRAGDTNGFVQSQDPYNLVSELSVIGTSISPFRKGNFWGTTNCQGLTDKVKGELPGTVSDNHPYNQPIAKKPPTPSPCQ